MFGCILSGQANPLVLRRANLLDARIFDSRIKFVCLFNKETFCLQQELLDIVGRAKRTNFWKFLIVVTEAKQPLAEDVF